MASFPIYLKTVLLHAFLKILNVVTNVMVRILVFIIQRLQCVPKYWVADSILPSFISLRKRPVIIRTLWIKVVLVSSGQVVSDTGMTEVDYIIPYLCEVLIAHEVKYF